MQSSTFATYVSDEPTYTDRYLNQISAVALLSADEEQRLARLARCGDAAAREQLICANLRLVVSIAKKYRQSGVAMDDLIQYGNLGLLTAVTKYDPERGTRFTTMATWWVRQSIVRHIADESRTIRLPVHMADRIRAVRRFLASHDGPAPSAAQIATALEMTVKQVETVLTSDRAPVSLDYPLGDDWDASEYGEFVPDPAADVATRVDERVMREQVAAVLGRLGERERLILTLRYGLDGGESHTLEAIGQKIGITRERVRQLEAEALQTLRHPSVGGKLRGWLR